jgi:hypothetical protein
MRIRLAACVVLLVTLTSVPAFAQSTAQTPQTPPPTTLPATTSSTTQQPATSPDDATDLPVDVNRIRKRLETPSPFRVDESRVKFHVEVVAKQYTFKDYLGDRSLRGNVPGSQMTHQEFLDMVNPKYLNSSAGFTATDTLQAALFNWAVGNAVKKGVQALKNARNESEVRAIRAQIDRELAALRGGGQ